MSTVNFTDESLLAERFLLEAPYTPPDINVVKQLHRRLLVRYIEVLNKVSSLPKRVKFLTGGRNFPPTPKFLIALFVESHIRTKLKELSIAYLYLSNSLPIENPEPKEAREWLKNTTLEIQKIADTLQSTTNLRGFLTLAWPYLLTASSIALGIKDKKNLLEWLSLVSPERVVIGFLIAYVPLLVATTTIYKTFTYKRALFLTRRPVDQYEVALKLERQPLQENVYELEDQLFDLLKRGKNKEFALDFVAGLLNSILLAPVVYLWGTSEEGWFGWLIFIAGVVVLLWPIFRYRARIWR